MRLTTPTRRIADIIIENRVREDKGDIDALAELVRESKVMQPVVVDATNRLIDGERRILAAQRLGWESVPVFVAAEPKEAIAHLIAERNLNNSKPFTTSELATMARQIEEVERAKAAERRNAPLNQGAESPVRQNSDERGNIAENGRSDDAAAKAVGVSRDTLRKMKEIQDAAKEDADRFGDLIAMMDNKSVNAAYKELKKRKVPQSAQPEPASQPAQVSEQADPLKVAADAFCGRINAMTRQLDEMVRQCDELKVQPLGYEIHWLSITDSLKQIRQRLHAGRPKQPCPYCKRKGTKEGGRAACTACNGTGHVNETGYRSGCKAVGFHVEEDTE